jgi:chromosome segregation ATPase
MSKALVDGALAHLQALLDSGVDLEDLHARRRGAQADLDATNRALDEAKAQLVEAQVALARAQGEGHRQLAELRFGWRKALEEIGERIERLRKEEAELRESLRLIEQKSGAVNSEVGEWKRRLQ